MDRRAQILKDSETLNELRANIWRKVAHRDKSEEARAAWSAACGEFHEKFGSLFYPGGSEGLRQLRAKDPTAIDAAIDFLAADPVHFRSGYVKDRLWRRAPGWSLSESQVQRIEAAALAYLEKRIRRDFWYMCRAMARMARPSFWQSVTAALGSSDALISKRASFLFVYSLGIEQGETLRRNIRSEVIRRKFGGG
jgi:hypothetical protein